MTRTKLSLTLLAALVCGCASKEKPQRVIAPIAPGSFEVSWSADTGVTSPYALYQAGNLLFVYGKNNLVSVFDVNGGLKFRTTIGENGDVLGPPVLTSDEIIFPTSATLERYTRGGGKIKSTKLPQPMRSPAVREGESLYVATDTDTGGRVAKVRLNVEYNFYEWTVTTGIVTTKPLLWDGAIYAATEDGVVKGINPEGSKLWAAAPEMSDGFFHTDGKIVAPLVGDESGIYVASTDTKLYCLAPNTGRVRWQYYAGARLTTPPTVTADFAYQFVEGQGIVALAKKPGEPINTPKWTFADGKQVIADDANYAYVITDNNAVAAVNKADGTLAFTSQRADLSKTVLSPDAKNPTVFGLTKGNQLICIKPVLRPGVVGELAMLTELP
ncbi:MAG: PQQ-binding-like beta-propeller repeat protein [Tepidisphaeraceae bacterium]